jgi:PTS system mannose-specific IIA component
MFGVVIVAHENLADEFLKVLTHVMGKQEFIETLNISADNHMEDSRKQLSEKIKSVDQGKGVVILTDMFGGTPSNLAMSFLKKGSIEVMAGMNIPALIKLADVRQSMDIKNACQHAQEAGKKYIQVGSSLLTGNP